MNDESKHWVLRVMIPNIAIALFGVFLAVLCYGLMGWISSWENQSQIVRYIVGGCVGMGICIIPFIVYKPGRQLLSRFIQKKAVLWILAIEAVVWIFAIIEKNDTHEMTFMFDRSFSDYIFDMLKSGCAVMSVLSCIVGILLGTFTFITFIFQRNPQQLWDDTTPTKRD